MRWKGAAMELSFEEGDLTEDMDLEAQETFKRTLEDAEEQGDRAKKIKRALLISITETPSDEPEPEEEGGEECKARLEGMHFPCLDGWTLGQFIAKGSYGCVYLACQQASECQAVKIQQGAFDVESAYQERFSSMGLAPRVYEWCKGQGPKRLFAMRMQSVDGTLANILKRVPAPLPDELEGLARALRALLRALRSQHVMHRDLSAGNIGYMDMDGQRRLVLIDFGLSQDYSRWETGNWDQLQDMATADDFSSLLSNIESLNNDASVALGDLLRKGVKGFFSPNTLPFFLDSETREFREVFYDWRQYSRCNEWRRMPCKDWRPPFMRDIVSTRTPEEDRVNDLPYETPALVMLGSMETHTPSGKKGQIPWAEADPGVAECYERIKGIRFPCLKGWDLGKVLGRGLNGCVYLACHQGDTCRGVKIQRENPEQEVAIQRRFARQLLAPEVYDWCKGVSDSEDDDREFYAIFMELIDGTAFDFLNDWPAPSTQDLTTMAMGLREIVRGLNREGINHGDMHSSNIGYTKSRIVGEPAHWVMLDFGFAGPQVVELGKPEPRAYDLSRFIQGVMRLGKPGIALIGIIRKNIKSFYEPDPVPRTITALLGDPRTLTLLGFDALVHIATYFTYQEVLNLITRFPNRTMEKALSSNAVWERMVFRDYRYVYYAVKASRGRAVAAIAAMARNKGADKTKRFWKRIYEWALTTSREVVSYQPAQPGDFRPCPWGEESLLLLSDFQGTEVSKTLRARIMNTFTKAVTLDIRLRKADKRFGDLGQAALWTVPPYVCLASIAQEAERQTTFQVWNVSSGNRIVAFNVKGPVITFTILGQGVSEPLFFYARIGSLGKNLIQWNQAHGKRILLTNYGGQWEAFSGHYFCYINLNADKGVQDIVVYDLASQRRLAFERGLHVRVQAFYYPYIVAKVIGEDAALGRPPRATGDRYVRVYDVSQPDQPNVWQEPIVDPDTKVDIGKGFIVMTSGRNISQFYTLGTPSPGDNHPPTFVGSPITVWAGTHGHRSPMGRYFISSEPSVIAMLGPHADHLFGPPQDTAPELERVPDSRKPMRRFLASTGAGR